jgi:hypothetical protein
MKATNLFLLTLCAAFVLAQSISGEAQTVDASPTASTAHLFPQFADGRFTDGTYYRTTLMISNLSDTAPAACSLQLHGLTLSKFALSYTLTPGGFAMRALSSILTSTSRATAPRCCTE